MSRVRLGVRSVRGRITLAATAVFGLAMILGGLFLLNRAEQAWVDDLRAQDLAELEAIERDLLFIQALDEAMFGELVLPVGVDGTSYELIDGSGAIVAATPAQLFGGVAVVGEVPAGEVPFIPQGPIVLADVSPGEVVTVEVPVELSGDTLMLTASSSLEPVNAAIGTLRGILLVAVPLLIAGVAATTWFVTGRAFRPVKAITDRVERITDDRLDERVPVPTSHDEVAHLATTMNKMLSRLASGRDQQRTFVSDASHELRNPIATSRAKLEVALAHPDLADWSETAAVVLEEQERLSDLVGDLLQLARIDERNPVVAVDVDLDDIVFAEASRVEGLEIAVDRVSPARVHGDPQQLTHLIRNLLDNAARHARGRVVVSLEESGSEVILAVEDDGPGIPPDHRETVFERFVRVDEPRDRTAGGAGLGLALVAAIAGSHGGSVTAAESDLGGARLEIRLPSYGS